MPTWAEAVRRVREDAERAALAVGTAAALVLSLDAVALHRAAGHERCGPATLPPPSRLQVTMQLDAPILRNGDRVRGRATVLNRGGDPVLVTGARAVLATPGTRRPLSWPEHVPYGTAQVRPGTYAQVPFVLHIERCRRGASPPFSSGFYEVVLLLEERDATGRHLRSSSGKAVIVSP